MVNQSLFDVMGKMPRIAGRNARVAAVRYAARHFENQFRPG